METKKMIRYHCILTVHYSWTERQETYTCTIKMESHMSNSDMLAKCIRKFKIETQYSIVYWSCVPEEQEYAYVITYRSKNGYDDNIYTKSGVVTTKQDTTRDGVFNEVWSELKKYKNDHVIHWSLEKNKL